jgi:hypothetical protein
VIGLMQTNRRGGCYAAEKNDGIVKKWFGFSLFFILATGLTRETGRLR